MSRPDTHVRQKFNMFSTVAVNMKQLLLKDIKGTQ